MAVSRAMSIENEWGIVKRMERHTIEIKYIHTVIATECLTFAFCKCSNNCDGGMAFGKVTIFRENVFPFTFHTKSNRLRQKQMNNVTMSEKSALKNKRQALNCAYIIFDSQLESLHFHYPLKSHPPGFHRCWCCCFLKYFLVLQFHCITYTRCTRYTVH